MRYFSVKEAEALIGDLEEIFARARALRDQAEKKAQNVRALEEADTDPASAALERGQLMFLANGINECLGQVAALGAVPKGLDPALVDFPHRLDGREVYLCWSAGEKNISHYHGIEEGFGGRTPLPKKKAAS
ncbi:MAG: DUF2203 domain-containing protein [Elusimicrobia bacterium]|nr:DUF2203 domain-containing protein [Elusimicrobiota bacterium]